MKYETLLLSLLLAGCASPPPRVIKLDSQPSGARVFFGVGPNENFAASARQYVGQTPCTFTPEQNGNGTFKLPGALLYSTFVPPCAVFTAEPPGGATNLFQKKEVYHGGTIATPPDKIPVGIFFDLSKP